MADGSASITIGGFIIKASSGTASNGVFVTVFVISRNGVQSFANDIDGIVSAAQRVQQRSFGGVVEDVAQWVAGSGAARLQQQAEAQVAGAPQSTGSTVSGAQTARDDAANTQIPEVTADDTATRSSNAVESGDTADANFQLENGDTADNNLSLTTTGNVNAGNNNQVNDDTGTAASNAAAGSGTNPTTGVANLLSPQLLYKATMVTSKFSKGRFTQDLEGVLLGLTPENGSLNGTVRF
jgi:hypothetical protein